MNKYTIPNNFLKKLNYNLNIKNDESWPKISIVIPSYNQPKFIEKSILSVLNQNYCNTELIIIDGGSNDKTIEKIKKYEDYLKSMNHKNVHIVNFEDLVFETQKSMEEVSNFLNIDYEKSLECASLNSIQLESQNNKFIGKINDDPSGHISRIHGLILKFLLN